MTGKRGTGWRLAGYCLADSGVGAGRRLVGWMLACPGGDWSVAGWTLAVQSADWRLSEKIISAR